jgi:peroxiredoxin
MRSPLVFLALALVAGVPPAAAQPGDPPGGLGAGAPLPEPDLTLTAADGRALSVRSAMGPNGLVVVFWSNGCPWAERNAERLAALGRDYSPAGIGFVAVNPNDPATLPAEGAEGMQRAAAALGFPYLSDEGGALARAFGVRSAPTTFLFDAAGRLVYEGAIDDSPADPASVEVPYLQQAMDQHLAGVAVEVQRTAALGCAVQAAGAAR